MKTHSIVAFAAAAGLAAGASAQIITTPGITAKLALSWIEDPAFSHNDDGGLEPGEHALLIMNVSFTGQFAVVQFSGPIGMFSSGTILGLSSAYFDIRSTSGDASGLYNGGITIPSSTSVGPNNNAAGTSGYGVRGGWRLGGNIANGTQAANGFQNIGPGQFPADPSQANVTNPINGMERLGWVPNSYASRVQTFTVAPAFGKTFDVVGLYCRLDGETGAIAYLSTSSITFGSVDIPIGIPAPNGLALLALRAVVGGRRRH